MKRKLKLLLSFIMISVFVSGCSFEKDGQKDENIMTDNKSSYIYQMSSGLIPVQEGYYMMVNGILYYYDKKQSKVVPVCNKPECKHEMSGECNANMSDYVPPIYYYNNKIYAVSIEYTPEGVGYADLYEIGEDGSSRKKLYTMYMASEENESIGFEMCISGGYAYYSFDAENPDNKAAELYRRKLEKDAEAECIYRIKGEEAEFFLDMYENNIYIRNVFCGQSGKEKIDLVKWDTESEKVTAVKDNITQYVKIGDSVFYARDDKIIKMNEETKKEETIYQGEEVDRAFIKSDGTYLYLDNLRQYYEDLKTDYTGRHIKVLDTKGNEVEDLKTDNGDEFMGGDDKYLFFSAMEVGMYVYDKKSLGTGEIKREDLIKLNDSTHEMEY